MADNPAKKRVIVHIGPHKTGSTAIQHCLLANAELLLERGVFFLHDRMTHSAAVSLSEEKFEDAERQLNQICEIISASPTTTVMLSQEDFSGDLPGRSRSTSIYPKLAKNLRIIARSFAPHNVYFLFFEREEESWLRSCYNQHLQHRGRFSTFDDFKASFEESFSWQRKLERPREALKDRIVVMPYSKKSDAGVKGILRFLGIDEITLRQPVTETNVSPSIEKMRILERINAQTSFRSTSWFSKSLIMKDWKPRDPVVSSQNEYYPNRDLAYLAFPKLAERATKRFHNQLVADVLPPRDVDLEPYVFDILPTEISLPDVSRSRMEDQSRILDYHLRGKSQLAKLNALTISYLRRDTQHTSKAKTLFHRIWKEKGVVLVNELSTRWLISTLQTFLDHGENEAQKIIGGCGHFYANMIKIYECERSIEGLAQDGTYASVEPKTPSKFSGLDRYKLGGSDIHLNTNALALDLAIKDDVAGLVLIEFLLRVKGSGNVFTRMDRSRKAHNIAIPNFTDTWSFFEPL